MAASLFVRALSSASLLTLGTWLALNPQPARAQGFTGTGTVDYGTAAIDVSTPGTTNVNLPNTSTRATITWTPTDTVIGGGPIDFLPSGNVVNYTGDIGASGPYTVLNRIIPVDPSRAIAFNGTVNSASNVRVFFYSPGGLLISSTARFNVGGLLLSTSDLALDGMNDFMPVLDQFSVAGTAGSASAIEIQAGAEIRAEAAGQSNFIVAVAPRIQQDGLVSARGSVALVAAESADFAIDSQGLFNITVSQGSEVATNTFSHTGTTGGPDAAGGGEFRRVYMVAVPKNNAISMAIQSGGSIGFDIAGAANMVGNQIILSAGHNIADTGAGDPIVATQAGVGPADVTVQRGAYTSNTFVRASGNATVMDNIPGGTPDISFASDLSVRATSSAVVNAAQGSISVGGDLTVSADAGSSSAGMAFAGTELAGTTLNVAGALIVTARDFGTNPFASIGGIAKLETIGGTITVGGPVLVSATAEGVDSITGSGGNAFGGQALINASNGGTITVTTGDVVADAFADGGLGANNIGDQGGNAFAGTAHVAATGAGSAITVANSITVDAQAVAGDAGSANGQGGTATGGIAEILATGGTASVNAGDFISTMSSATGGNGSLGGNATGGTSQLIADNGSISTVDAAPITANAQGSGGEALGAGSGGSGTGGVALVEVRGAGSVEVNSSLATWQNMSINSLAVRATASGGGSSNAGGIGGAALSGQAKISIADIGGQITVHGGPTVMVSSDATGGGAFGGGAGGSATGGLSQFINHGGSLTLDAVGIQIGSQAQAGVSSLSGVGLTRSGIAELIVDQGGSTQIGGNLVITSYSVGNSSDTGGDALGGRTSAIVNSGTLNVANSTVLEATTIGGDGSNGLAGNAEGGLAEIRVSNGGIADFREDVNFFAFGVGGNGTVGRGGSAVGGQVLVTADGGTLKLASVSGGITVDTSAAAGTGLTQGTVQYGSALVTVNSSAAAILGVAASAPLGSIETDAPITLTGNTQLLISSAGSIEIAGTVSGTGDGARLALQADNQGSGTGTVVFSGVGSVNLSGAQATVDIYHNPSVFGTATDYSANVLAGALTPYQLVHNAGQLQSINNYLGSSFALARDVDLGSLASSNAGAGFQSIGTDTFGNVVGGVGFTGNFDGQDFTIRNLYINRTTSEVGLFGRATGGTIRNVILSDGSVTSSGSNVGSLVGNLENATLSNAHSSVNVSTSAGGDIGGLVGHVGTTSTVKDSSASGTVINIGGPHSTGGLVGYNGGTILRSWATGNVTLDGTNRGVGGLVGFSDGFIDQSYATGNVTGGPGIHGVGGLVGFINNGTVSRSYATGDVSGTLSVGAFVGYIAAAGTASTSYGSGAVTGTTDIGGFVGTNEGSITNSYWDNFSTGQSVGFGNDVGSITNLNAVTSDPGQSGATNYAFGLGAYSNFGAFDWTTFDGQSRPIGRWEITRSEHGLYTVRSAHQLQFVQNDLTGNYRLAFDIDASEMQRAGSVFGGKGFIPIGSGVAPFTGQFNGAGHVVSNLYINRPTGNIGLFDTNSGTIRNVGLANVALSGGNNRTGALAGTNNGMITGSFATGTINATGNVTGGLVGENNNIGTISQSYASVNVTGVNTAGGLAGINAGAISFSFANGSISAPNAGGLVGTNAVLATVGSSYWDTQTSGRANACGTDDGTNCGAAGGLTTVQSRQTASYTGWSLDTVGGQNNIWRMYEGASAPLLKAFLKPLLLSPADLTWVYDTTIPTVPVVPVFADLSRIFGTATLSGAAANVGTYSINYGGGLSSVQSGYDLIAGPAGTLTVTPALLNVTANSALRLYGDVNPALTYNTVGLLGSDTLSGSLDTTANALSGIGGYAITQGTLGNANYIINYNGDTLTITPRPLVIMADAASRLYGDVNPALTYTAGGAGLVNGDTLSGALDTVANAASGIGAYTINQGTLAASPNYALIYNGANLSVVARSIIVTGDTVTRLYGDANPALTYTVGGAGLVNGDTLTGTLDTLANGISNVGAYTVTQGTVAASPNYALTYVDGSLNVNARPLSVIADAASRLYGDVNPTFTYSTTGLVNGDMVTGMLDSAATVISNVGTYGINQGSIAASSNYAISYIGANLSVTPRPLNVIADAASRLYGDANPTLTYTAPGLVNGDTLTGTLNTVATVTSNNGVFAINQGSLDNSNYAISYSGANLSVVARSIIVTGDTVTRLYGDANPALTYTVGGAGLVNGDTLTGTLDTLANGISNVGAYTVTQGTVAASPNYALTYVDGSLNVNARPLSVIADAASRLYGDVNPTFTYSTTGLVNGDMVTGMLDSAATVISNVGTYGINQGSIAASSNYVISYIGANLSVTPRILSVIADAASRIYGNANPVLTYTTTGLVNGDTVTGALESSATINSNVGTYGIGQGTLAASLNYSVAYTGATLTVTPCITNPACAPPAAVLAIVSQIGTDIQQQDEEAEATEVAEKEAAEVSSSDPKVMIQSVINTSSFTQPLPVRDLVSGVGNSTIWIPGDVE